MTNKIFFNALVKSAENKLLTETDFNNLIDADDLKNICKVLNTKSVLQGFVIAEKKDLMALILNLEKEFFNLIKSSKDESIIKFFILPGEYADLETAYINFLKGQNTENEIEFDNNVQREMFNKIKNVDYSGFSKFQQQVLQSLNNRKNLNFFLIDTCFKKALYNELSATIINKDLLKILNFKIDVENISLALRLKDFALCESCKLDGGTLKIEEFKKLTSLNMEEIIEYFKLSPYSSLITFASKANFSGNSLDKYENAVDSFATKYFDDLRLDVSKTFLRYCFLMQSQLKNLRIVFEGFYMGLDKRLIKNRLRGVYAR